MLTILSYFHISIIATSKDKINITMLTVILFKPQCHIVIYINKS
jgi:hypothetical protein